MEIIGLKELGEIRKRLSSVLSPCGFDSHPFKIGWYNEQVSNAFQLPYHEDTLSFIIISTPSMFEKAFIPFVSVVDCERTNMDPLDRCMKQHFSLIKEEFPNLDIQMIHDFELTPSRRPKILVQTAGHVSGAVRYYQRKDLTSDPWEPTKKVCGVCIHPNYGGWFALRGVAVFTTLQCPELPKEEPRLVSEYQYFLHTVFLSGRLEHTFSVTYCSGTLVGGGNYEMIPAYGDRSLWHSL